MKLKEIDQGQKGETEVHTEQQKGDLPNSGSTPASMATNQKLVCLRCKEKGHLARDCHARIFCTNCSKPTHKIKIAYMINNLDQLLSWLAMELLDLDVS